MAVSLGEVLGGRGFLRSEIRSGRVKSFMEKRVKTDDAVFASTLRTVTGWTKYRDGTTFVADKTECIGIEQKARSFGSIR